MNRSKAPKMIENWWKVVEFIMKKEKNSNNGVVCKNDTNNNSDCHEYQNTLSWTIKNNNNGLY